MDDVSLGRKIDTLIRLNALLLVGSKTGGEAIDVLVKVGLETDLVAELVGTTPGTVRARRSAMNRRTSASNLRQTDQ